MFYNTKCDIVHSRLTTAQTNKKLQFGQFILKVLRKRPQKMERSPPAVPATFRNSVYLSLQNIIAEISRPSIMALPLPLILCLFIPY